MRIARQLADQDYQEKLPILQQWNQVAARLAAGPSVPSSSSWPSSPVVPQTTQSAQSPPLPPSPSTSSVERARLTDYSSSSGNNNQAAWLSSSPSTAGGHSYANHVNHYTSNINSVWPSTSASSVVGRSAPLVAAAPVVPSTGYFNGAPQTWFQMSSHGPNPYNIAYSY